MDSSCPELHFQKQVRHLAASRNIPLLEAKKTIRRPHLKISNPHFDFSNFPELNDSPTPDSLYSDFAVVPPSAPSSSRAHSYSNILKSSCSPRTASQFLPNYKTNHFKNNPRPNKFSSSPSFPQNPPNSSPSRFAVNAPSNEASFPSSHEEQYHNPLFSSPLSPFTHDVSSLQSNDIYSFLVHLINMTKSFMNGVIPNIPPSFTNNNVNHNFLSQNLSHSHGYLSNHDFN